MRINILDDKKRFQVRHDGMYGTFDNDICHADIIIADITECCPNVMLAVGGALAARKPLLLMTQDQEWVPGHLRGQSVKPYSLTTEGSLAGLGSSLLSWLYQEADHAESIRSAEAIYPVEGYAAWRDVHLENFLHVAHRQIDILTIGFNFLYDAYQQDGRCYMDDIRKMLQYNSHLRVRLLAVDPECEAICRRAIQLGCELSTFREEQRARLLQTAEIAESYGPQRFSIRCQETLPYQIMCRVDDDMFLNVVTQTVESRDCITLRFPLYRAGIRTSFLRDFQDVWTQGRPWQDIRSSTSGQLEEWYGQDCLHLRARHVSMQEETPLMVS